MVSRGVNYPTIIIGRTFVACPSPLYDIPPHLPDFYPQSPINITTMTKHHT